jgi:hypothetical protein
MAQRGFFRNAVEAMMASREKQAGRYVASALLMFDDETLKAAGHNRADLQRRSRGGAPYMF